jgi:branched-chain amino acid transport system ATP-binding protein
VSLLEVSGLDVHYGAAHVLQGVSFEMDDQPVALIGRNGMGKTTLCNAIMQMRPARVSGSIRFQGRELVGSAS